MQTNNFPKTENLTKLSILKCKLFIFEWLLFVILKLQVVIRIFIFINYIVIDCEKNYKNNTKFEKLSK